MAFAPVFIWMQSIEDISIYIDYETPPGQVYYVLSKLAGLYAVFLLWLQVVLAVVNGTPFGARFSFWNVKFHRNLGLVTFGCILLHTALFVIAVSLRKAHFAYEILLPNFSHGFYGYAVTLGVFAIYGLVVVVIAGYLRKRGIKNTKWLHRISVVALILTLTHCLLIGTETRYSLMIAIYTTMVGTLITALYYRYKTDFVTHNT